MRILVVFIISLLGVLYFQPYANAMMLFNAEKVYPVPEEFVMDVDIDCDYDPETNTVSNCKVVSKSDE